jgi:glucose-6-phosphate 1-dehydrogenase
VPGVASDSTVETFVAVTLSVDSWRWEGVPIHIRAGKCLPVSATAVSIQFHRPPQNVCGLESFQGMNALRFQVRPETGVTLTLAGKEPGIDTRPQVEDLTFARQPGVDPRPYDRLIGAALEGDQWLFTREDTVESAWRIIDPILDDALPLYSYQRGTWGPEEAGRLLPASHSWRDPVG